MATDADLIRIVALACNDVRTPMATLTGFSKALAGTGLEGAAAEYARTIAAAAGQIDEIVGELGLVARIAEGRYRPVVQVTDLRELMDAVAAQFEPGRVSVEGDGAAVAVDRGPAERSLASLVRTTMRNGALDRLTVVVAGAAAVLAPIEPNARPVVTGREVREFSAAAALRVLAAQGATSSLDGDRLVVTFPERY
jgi:signal transduction histidine kinase